MSFENFPLPENAGKNINTATRLVENCILKITEKKLLFRWARITFWHKKNKKALKLSKKKSKKYLGEKFWSRKMNKNMETEKWKNNYNKN